MDLVTDLCDGLRRELTGLHASEVPPAGAAIFRMTVRKKDPFAAKDAFSITLRTMRRQELLVKVIGIYTAVPKRKLDLSYRFTMALKIGQHSDDAPELFFGEIGFHGVDQCRGDNDLPVVARDPVVENTIPWAMLIYHIQIHPCVITHPAVLAHIVPKGFDCFTGNPSFFETVDYLQAGKAVFRTDVQYQLPGAEGAAFLNWFSKNHSALQSHFSDIFIVLFNPGFCNRWG
jgi:hypothetical protein